MPQPIGNDNVVMPANVGKVEVVRLTGHVCVTTHLNIFLVS